MSAGYRKTWMYILILSIVWLLAALLVNPLGEFPINDDWEYAKKVFHLAVNYQFNLSNWPNVTLISQTLWGTLFCKIFGFSFTTLRMSVLLLGWTGVIITFLLALKVSGNHELAMLTALMLALNPLWFSLSYTFMTDVPFLVFTTAAILFYALFFEKNRIRYTWYAMLMALVATMIRQPGVWIPLTYLIVSVLTGRIKLKYSIIFVLQALIVIAVMQGFSWYIVTHNPLPGHFLLWKELILEIPKSLRPKIVLSNFGIILFYFGILLVPFSIVIQPSLWKESQPRHRLVSLVIAFLFAIPVVLILKRLPVGNIIYNLGVGPLLLKDTFWGYHLRPVLFPGFRYIVIFTGISGSILLIYSLVLTFLRIKFRKQFSTDAKIRIVILLIAVGYFLFFFTRLSFFDRYFLPQYLLIPLLIMPLKMTWKPVFTFIAFAYLGWITFFSVAATHDFMSFNRARWKGLDQLTRQGISPHSIDGGYEFNGWYGTGPINNLLLVDQKSWWYVDDDRYVAAMGDMQWYNKIASYPFRRWLSFSNDSVLILKKRDVYGDSLIIKCGAESLTKKGDYFASSDSTIHFGNVDMRTNDDARSGNYSILLDKDHLYGFGVHLPVHYYPVKIRVKAWIRYDDNRVRIAITSPNGNKIFAYSNLPDPDHTGWEMIHTEANFPANCTYPDLLIYLWNYSGKKVHADDITVSLFYDKPGI